MSTMKKLLNRIEINPKIMVGKPVIRGTRIPVYIILNLLSQGASETEILEDYPDLKKDDIKAALALAASRFEREESYLYGPPSS